MLLFVTLGLGAALGAPTLGAPPVSAVDVNPLHANLTCIFEHGVDHKCVRAPPRRERDCCMPHHPPHYTFGTCNVHGLRC